MLSRESDESRTTYALCRPRARTALPGACRSVLVGFPPFLPPPPVLSCRKLTTASPLQRVSKNVPKAHRLSQVLAPFFPAFGGTLQTLAISESLLRIFYCNSGEQYAAIFPPAICSAGWSSDTESLQHIDGGGVSTEGRADLRSLHHLANCRQHFTSDRDPFFAGRFWIWRPAHSVEHGIRNRDSKFISHELGIPHAHQWPDSRDHGNTAVLNAAKKVFQQ